MAYELKQGEKLPRAFRRITKRQVERIMCDLAPSKSNHQAESIHSARKNLKKARAALRLVRDELGRRVYKRDAGHFRKVARALSAPRDAEVQLKTVEGLLEKYHGQQIHEALMKLHRVLQGRLRAVVHQPDGKTKKLEAELQAVRRDAKNWPVDKLKWADVACGVGQTYGRGVKAFQAALRTHTPEDLHEWRKRAKDLWYQLRILRPVQEEAITALADRMKQLGQLLGDDHDMFMVAEAAKTAELNCRELEAITGLVERSRARLQKEAFKLGRRTFGEKPSAFVRRIQSYGKEKPVRKSSKLQAASSRE